MRELKYFVLQSSMIKVFLTNAGAAITGIELNNKDGQTLDVVLGFDRLERYLNNNVYFGSIVGRYAGEVRPPNFQWQGRTYFLPTSRDGVHLHGGKGGLSFQPWYANCKDGKVCFEYLSTEEESGYPQDVYFLVEYSMEDEHTLLLKYSAVAKKDTPVNLTSHSYFNLDGHAYGSIGEHELFINADEYTITSGDELLSGQHFPCSNSAYDFTTLRNLNGKSYDCNYILKKTHRYDAMLHSKRSGIYVELYCTQPCLQLYTACETFTTGKQTIYRPFSAICLEPQHMPNAVNLQKEEIPYTGAHNPYEHIIKYRFGIL